MLENTSFPSVSVVIPTYNRAHCIGECLASVLHQTWSDFEVIVVDDASTDDTRVRVAAIDDRRIRYFQHDENLGGGAARNTGIMAARGDYVAFLDSDDRWASGKLEMQLRSLRAAGRGYGVSYTWMSCVDEAGNEIERIDRTHQGHVLEPMLISNFVGSFSCVIADRALLLAVGGLDEEMRSCQDWDLFIRLAKRSRFHLLPEYLVHYTRNTSDRYRISTNPGSVIRGHRRIRDKYASDYLGLAPEQRAEALGVFFNVFAAAGAVTDALDAGSGMLFSRANMPRWKNFSRGMARAIRKAAARRLHLHPGHGPRIALR